MCAQVEQRMTQDNHEGTKSQEEIMQEQEAKIRSGAVHDLVSDAPLNYAAARTPEACYEWRQTSGTPKKIDRTSLLYALANLNRHTEQLPMDLSVPRDDPRSGVELRSKASKECGVLMNDLAGGFKSADLLRPNGNALAVPAGVVLPETREIFESRQRNLIAAFVKWYPLAMHKNIADHNFTPEVEQVGHGPREAPSSSSQTRKDTNLSCFNLFSYIPPRSLLSCSYLDMDLTKMALGQKFTEQPKTLEVEREASSDETARTTSCITDRSVFSKQAEDVHLSAQNPYTVGVAEQAASTSVVEDNANDPSVTTFLCGQRPALWTLLQGLYSEPTLSLAVVKRLLLAKKPRRRTAAGGTTTTYARTSTTSSKGQAAENGEQDSLFLIPRVCLNYVQLSDTVAIRRENIKHKQCFEPDDSRGKRAVEPDGLLTEDDRLWLGRAQALDPKVGITVTTPSMAGPGTATHRIEDLTPRSFTHQLPLHTLPSHYTHVLFGILHLITLAHVNKIKRQRQQQGAQSGGLTTSGTRTELQSSRDQHSQHDERTTEANQPSPLESEFIEILRARESDLDVCFLKTANLGNLPGARTVSVAGNCLEHDFLWCVGLEVLDIMLRRAQIHAEVVAEGLLRLEQTRTKMSMREQDEQGGDDSSAEGKIQANTNATTAKHMEQLHDNNHNIAQHFVQMNRILDALVWVSKMNTSSQEERDPSGTPFPIENSLPMFSKSGTGTAGTTANRDFTLQKHACDRIRKLRLMLQDRESGLPLGFKELFVPDEEGFFDAEGENGGRVARNEKQRGGKRKLTASCSIS
ncbi:unnamed protein product [Amoebophrya sp. A120]|nr:unnamed protein product [Amoebophrya sp. A120]|eukprot:GSA120T00014786001.1